LSGINDTFPYNFDDKIKLKDWLRSTANYRGQVAALDMGVDLQVVFHVAVGDMFYADAIMLHSTTLVQCMSQVLEEACIAD
jgi:hypothetical protein